MTFDDPGWLDQERQWLQAIRRGDDHRTGLSRLYDAFAGPLLVRVLLPRLGDRDLAADVLADVFETAIRRIDSYQDRGRSIWSWLATIAANRAMDVHRERARAGRAQAGCEALLEPLWAGVGPAGPDRGVEERALRDEVAKVLGEINPRYRRALELRFLEERSREECATLMSVTLGTFDVLLLRALRAFRAGWPSAMAPGAAETRGATGS